MSSISYVIWLSSCIAVLSSVYGAYFPNVSLLDDSIKYHQRMGRYRFVYDISWTATKEGEELTTKHLQQVRRALLTHTILPEVLIAMIIEYRCTAWDYAIHHVHDAPVMQIVSTDRGYASSISSREFLQQSSGVPPWLGIRWNVATGKEVLHEYGEVPGKGLPYWLSGARAEGILEYAKSLDQQKMAVCRSSNIEVWQDNENFRFQLKDFYAPPVMTSEAGLSAVTFSPCGNYLCIGALNGVVTVMDLVLKKPLYELVHPHSVTALAVSFLGHELLVGLSTGSIVVWKGGPFSSFYYQVCSQEAASSAPTSIALPSAQLGKRSLFRSFCATMLSWRSKS